MKIKFLVLFLLLPMLALAQFNPYQHNAFTTNIDNTVRQEATFTNSSGSGNAYAIFLPDVARLGIGGFDPTSPNTSWLWNSGHSQEAESQFASTGSFAFSAGQDQQHKAVIQLGSAIATHDQVYVESDEGAEAGVTIPDWPTNSFPSKLFSFRTLSNSFSVNNNYVASGIRAEPTTPNNNTMVHYNPESWQLRVQPLSYSAGVPQLEVGNNGINVDAALNVGSSFIPSVVDTVVSNFVAAAVTNLTPKQLFAINNFVRSARNNGYWSKLIDFQPMVGGSAVTALFNLVNTNTFKMVVHGSVSYGSGNGIVLDGSTGWIDTGLNPSTSFASLSNLMFFCWVNNTTFSPANSSYMGSSSGGGSAGLVVDSSGGFVQVNAPNSFVTTDVSIPNSPNPLGVMGLSLTNSTTVIVTANSRVFGAINANPFQSGDTVNLALGDLSWNPTHATNSYSFCGAGNNFTSVDMTNLINDVTILNSNLSTTTFSVTGDSYFAGNIGFNNGGGILGQTNGLNANAGLIGEFTNKAVAVGSELALTTVLATNVTSFSLTPGDWDVEGNVNFDLGSATVTAMSACINTTANTMAVDGSETPVGGVITTTSDKASGTLPRKRVYSSTNIVVYLIGQSTFSAGTAKVYGSMTARRVH